jgi:deaminated glutathione amidase
MADQLRVTLVQEASELDPEANRARLAGLVSAGGDLVVLPEAFARDFGRPGSDVSAFAEPLDGPFATELARVAAERGTTVVAGMFRAGEDPDRPYNTLVVRGRAEASYDKVHLYDSFGYRESDRLSAGAWTPTLVEVEGFRVGLMTCYDLRFPELARALVLAGAEVLVVPAAWVAGDRKVDHWLTLLRARAIENTVHVVGVGQPAPRYTGHSAAFSPLGDVLVQTGPDAGRVEVVLTREALEEARRINPSLANRRG